MRRRTTAGLIVPDEDRGGQHWLAGSATLTTTPRGRPADSPQDLCLNTVTINFPFAISEGTMCTQFEINERKELLWTLEYLKISLKRFRRRV